MTSRPIRPAPGVYVADGGTIALYKVNVTTGAATEVGPYATCDANMAGLAFLARGSAAPEPGSIVLLMAGLGLIGLGLTSLGSRHAGVFCAPCPAKVREFGAEWQARIFFGTLRRSR